MLALHVLLCHHTVWAARHRTGYWLRSGHGAIDWLTDGQWDGSTGRTDRLAATQSRTGRRVHQLATD